jgi:hypothetical protein
MRRVVSCAIATRATGVAAIAVGVALSAGACGARSGLDLDSLSEGGLGGAAAHAPPADCADAGVTFIYVVTDEPNLYAFDPTTLQFTLVGPFSCAPSGPQSMAVDRAGQAFVESNEYRIFEVELGDDVCAATPYVPRRIRDFGMAFSSDVQGGGESLYLVDASSRLARLDLDTFAPQVVGTFSEDVGESELTGTGDGRLFAFGVRSGQRSHLAEIDKSNARVLSDVALDLESGGGWAFAWWGGAFYFFTSTGGASVVTRYDPASEALEQVATAPGLVVGAGVSTCAPVD